MVTVLAATALSFFAGSPAGAGPPCGPEAGDADGRIRFGETTYGNDVYSAGGAGQTASFGTNIIDMPFAVGTWTIKFENESSSRQNIRVGIGSNGDDQAFKTRFFRNGNNVTQAVLDGSLKFRRVKAGELTTPLKLKMTPRQSAEVGHELDFFFEGRYASAEPCEADLVRAHIEITNA